ncbi:ethylbenzene dehydrogenase-related protein [Trichloromonas sp.]|uniref:ethylbenzene dehydrogenase-related protein n=1 Tax=Trichloromonas sp. TaxID=3069249 RepID=UPI003D812EEA
MILLLLALAACKELPADRLYALHLDAPPSATDWDGALPRIVTVKGGRLHVRTIIDNIDEDTVHTSTASCHHGGKLPDPVPVDMRAFYTDREIFIRLSWPDATADAEIREWRFDGTAWQNLGNVEDGFGLAWDGGKFSPRFTCSVACHIDDFGVRGASFHATNRMKLAREGEWLDLWNWKARRTGRFGFADDRVLSSEGISGDVPGELFKENSRARLNPEGGILPFADGDQPIYDAEGLPVGKEFRPAGSTAPGFLTETPAGSRADVKALGRWLDGRWTVILRRALDSKDPRDVRFVPGDGEGVAFGLSIMDNTLFEHYASVLPERIVLLAAEPGAAKETGDK